ncbi:uncharacterized protein [Arachis hypogaea]|uniref:uncharacterized protein isoform X1 n=1 Tax=Arachis hypogaea TaxID=3818 RepID=UPI000DEC331A|nr:uncharacterized protein LOC112714400 isoform X1 [Arachis hypogaea]
MGNDDDNTDHIESVTCNETIKKQENTKQLFQICMEGRWKEVVEIYEKEKRAHTAKITRGGESALHLAVIDGQEEVVSELVDLIVKEKSKKEALRIQNKRKNTALHFAASMGTNNMVRVIADADPELVSFRNVDGETPLFLAAFHGRKEAFMILHYMFHKEPGTPVNYSNCRRNDGDTILHSTIAADNFELAFQIIQLYGDLVNWVNERGATPLHFLATKPSAFKSGSRLGRIETFIYHGIRVKQLKAETNYRPQTEMRDNSKTRYPKNYQACVDFMTLMKNAAWVATTKFPVVTFLIGKCSRKNHNKTQRRDLEAQERIASQTNLLGRDSKAQEKSTVNEIETDSSSVVYLKTQLEQGEDGEAQEKTNADTNSLGSESEAWSHPLFPENYECCASFLAFIYTVILVIFGKGTNIFKRIGRKKEKHIWSNQVMNELLKRVSLYEYDGNGSSSGPQEQDQGTSPYNVYNNDALDRTRNEQHGSTSIATKEMETPILIAARNGVIEMVERILEMFPVAVHDMDCNKKNIVLLAVEHRQPHLYEFLLKKESIKESLFRKVDHEGNSALHLAAKLGDYTPWIIPGAALQMYWELKWYMFVKDSMPPRFFGRYNKDCKTPREVLVESHQKLVKSGGEWLKQTSESCSVVAALIATVAFATSTTVPGGVQEDTGVPTLEGTAAFKVFAMASLVALACSVTAVVLFLSILTSRYQEYDFGNNLPRKLILGLTALFMSITSMLVSFCAGHFLVLRNKLRDVALPIYAVTCLPVTLFALAQFPLYIDLIWATFRKVPQRSYKATRL